MFKFLKDKLKSAVSKLSEDIEEQGETEEKEEIKEVVEEPKVQPKPTAIKEDIKEDISEEEPEEKKGFFAKIKEKISGPDEEEFTEVTTEEIEAEQKVEKEKKEAEKEKQKAEDKLKEKIEKKEVPTIQDLKHRKEEIKEKVQEVKKEIEQVEPEVKEPEQSVEHEQVQEELEKPKEPLTPEVKEEIKEEITEIKEEIKELPEEPKPEEQEEPEEIQEEKKGIFGKLKEKIVTKKINEKQFDDIFWDLEIALLENNVAVQVIEKIKSDLKQKLVENPIARGKIESTIIESLKETLEGLFDVEQLNILDKTNDKKPLVICFVGINGSGKTTTIAKVAKMFQSNDKSCILAAADTFRAAAIDQLQTHADKLGIKLIKHDYGSDAAAVAFDAVKHAESKGIDVVLIDTAGRMHSNSNLMDEMEKIIRVANPDLKIFVGESITGNDCTEQAKKFNETVGIDGIILSKADIDEKGGAAISVSHVTGKPIAFIGTGQEYDDLKEFDPAIILNTLEL